MDITDENKDELMLLCARLGIVSRLPAVLQAGANLKHTDKAGNTAVELAQYGEIRGTFKARRSSCARVHTDCQALQPSCCCWAPTLPPKTRYGATCFLSRELSFPLASSLSLLDTQAHRNTLTIFLYQNKKDPIDHAAYYFVKAAFAKHLAQVDITDQIKNGRHHRPKQELLLVFSRLGMASRLPAVLQAGADLKHTDEMCL